MLQKYDESFKTPNFPLYLTHDRACLAHLSQQLASKQGDDDEADERDDEADSHVGLAYHSHQHWGDGSSHDTHDEIRGTTLRLVDTQAIERQGKDRREHGRLTKIGEHQRHQRRDA